MPIDLNQFGSGLRVELKTTNIELTDDLRAYLENKLTNIDRLLNPADTSLYAQVELERTTKHHTQGKVFRSEINLFVGGKQLRAEAYGEDIRSAIDSMKAHAERELREHKNKRILLARRGAVLVKKLLHRPSLYVSTHQTE